MGTLTSPDANSAIQDQTASFRVWEISQIYGPTGNGRYVPNVDDLVFDKTQGFMIVKSVNETTLYTTLAPWSPPTPSNQLGAQDVLLGSGPGTVWETYRVWVNDGVLPHTLALDSRLHMYTSAITQMKLFRGTDISVDGEVISQYYDQSSNFVGENIPMELVGTDNINNLSIKAPKSGFTMSSLENGELVTAVFYDDVSGARSQAALLVHKSSYIRKTSDAMKYITGIELVSPFITADEPTVLKFALNMPVNSIPMYGQVNYSDGTTMQLPIDGTKFELIGLNNFIATSEGLEAPLVLFYTPSVNESSYGTTPTPNQKIAKQYKARTMSLDGSFSVKLFAFPRWDATLMGYVMEYYLYSLDRDTVYWATPYVVNGTNSPAFNGQSYAAIQNITVVVDLKQIDPVKFTEFRHVQSFGVTLFKPGTGSGELWTVQQAPGQNPAYGVNTKAKVTYIGVNHYTVDVSFDQVTLEAWLNQTYYAALPLVNPVLETVPPVPNYFAVVMTTDNGELRVEVPTSQWNIPLTTSSVPGAGRLVRLEFFQRSPAGDVQLAVAALPVELVNLA